MSSYILDKAYAIEDRDGIGAYLALVHGDAAGGARIPMADNPEGLLGVSVHSQSLQGANIAVRKAGIARVKAAGPIRLGEAVAVTKGGRVIGETAFRFGAGSAPMNALGFAETVAAADGDIIEVFIQLHQRTSLAA